MKVSVILPTYNRAHMITEAIDSVLSQTFEDFELIVVDNYSTDNTESVVKSYRDNRIRYFKHRNHGLVSVSRNYGIEKSSGEYIAFLDDDDLWLPEKLEKQLKILDSNKELGLVYSDYYFIESNGNLIGETCFRSLKPFRGNVFNELMVGNFIPQLTVLVRREVLDMVGGFNLRYKIAQDYDLWLRIAEQYPLDFTEEPLAKYRTHGGNISRNQELAVGEQIQLVEYWLVKKGDLKREFRRKAKQEQAIRHAWLLLYYFRNHENRKTVSECLNLIKLLPYSLVLIPKGSAKLGRVLCKSPAKMAQFWR